MKQSVNFSEFVDAFRAHGRQDQFSYEGKRALFDYLEQLEEDTGTEIELDVIALCCEYTEASLAEVADNYDQDPKGEDETDDEFKSRITEYLSDNTSFISVSDDVVIYQGF